MLNDHGCPQLVHQRRRDGLSVHARRGAVFSNTLILAVGHGDAVLACCGVLDHRMRVALPRSSRSQGASPYRWSTRLALRAMNNRALMLISAHSASPLAPLPWVL